MMGMLQTLYAKLAVALLGLIGLFGVFYISLTLFATRLYLQEFTQKLNQSLASNVVEENPLVRGEQVNEEALQEIFHILMVINPSLEVYLLDPQGRILAFSAPQKRIKRDRVSLKQVRAFLSGTREFPLRGDDPRDLTRRKVFSVAPVLNAGRLQGYLYVILGGEAYDSVADMVQASYVLRLAVGFAVAGLLVTLASGLLSFHWLTGRLRRLTAAVESFKHSDFQQSLTVPEGHLKGGGDEIDRLGVAFEQMSQRIISQINQLQQADLSRRELVANVSHDLRTPLALLQGYIETLKIKEATLSWEERQHYLELALKHTQQLGRLVSDLFQLATLEAHDTRLHYEAFSLGELAQDVAHKHSLQAAEKRIRLETDIPRKTPLVWGELGLVERVFENLLDNAIKYTPEGGTVRLSVVSETEHVVARVSDNGPGIPEDDLPHIFERFYRVGRHQPGTSEGAGLGLAIAQTIVQLHRSRLEIESIPGRGSVFGFRLPLYDAPATTLPRLVNPDPDAIKPR
jgi:two-component system, OmpR family, sensor kinase